MRKIEIVEVTARARIQSYDFLPLLDVVVAMKCDRGGAGGRGLLGQVRAQGCQTGAFAWRIPTNKTPVEVN